jgi:hypothetical protein
VGNYTPNEQDEGRGTSVADAWKILAGCFILIGVGVALLALVGAIIGCGATPEYCSWPFRHVGIQ